MHHSSVAPESAGSILSAWYGVLSDRGDLPAIIAPTGAPWRTFASIDKEARGLAEQWRHLPPRSVIAVQIGNSPAWPAVFLALLRLDLITIPLGSDAVPPDLAEAIIGADLVLRSNPIAVRLPRPALCPSVVLLKLTSGTTGAPRAVCFTAAQLAADCHQICDTMGIGQDDLNFAAIPLEHSYGFSNLVTPLLLRGVPMAITEDRLPRAMLATIERTGATVFPGTPVFYQCLADLMMARPPRLHLCISAGAPLPMAVWEKFRERYGLGIRVFYGSSECGGIAYDRHGEPVCDGFVGQPMERVLVTPMDDGRIEVRSDAVGSGYYPEDDRAVLADGRFVPGDLVRLCDEGLVLAGRASEFINVGGRKLNPFEVEQRLSGLPGIRQVIIFGVPSAIRGEEPVACVVGEGIDPTHLLKRCAQAVPAWQVPRDVWIVPEVPVSDRGKISRRALAERYLAERK